MNLYYICQIIVLINFTKESFAAKKKCDSDKLVKQIQIQTYRGHKQPKLTTFCGEHDPKPLKDCGKSEESKRISDGKSYNSSCLHAEDPRTVYRPSASQNRGHPIRRAVEQCSVNKTHVAMAGGSDRTSKSAEIQFLCKPTNCAWDCEQRTKAIKSDMAFNISAEEVFKSKYEEDEFKDAFFSKLTVQKTTKDYYRVKYRVCRDCGRLYMLPYVAPPRKNVLVIAPPCDGHWSYKQLTGEHEGCCTKFFDASVTQAQAAAACSSRGSTILGIKTGYLTDLASSYSDYFWTGGTFQVSTQTLSFYDGGTLSIPEVETFASFHRFEGGNEDVFPMYASWWTNFGLASEDPYAYYLSYLCGINC